MQGAPPACTCTQQYSRWCCLEGYGGGGGGAKAASQPAGGRVGVGCGRAGTNANATQQRPFGSQDVMPPCEAICSHHLHGRPPNHPSTHTHVAPPPPVPNPQPPTFNPPAPQLCNSRLKAGLRRVCSSVIRSGQAGALAAPQLQCRCSSLAPEAHTGTQMAAQAAGPPCPPIDGVTAPAGLPPEVRPLACAWAPVTARSCDMAGLRQPDAGPGTSGPAPRPAPTLMRRCCRWRAAALQGHLGEC